MKPRDFGIDLLRTIAVIAMMAAHTTRLIEFEKRAAWSYWILLLEPLIPTMFLLLVGLSLYQSHSKNGNNPTWWKGQVRRAFLLWFISLLFSVLELGPRLPDMFVASGILCTIAYSILLLTLLFSFPKSPLFISGALILGIATYYTLLSSHAFPWIMGNSPFLPLLLFACFGAIWGYTSTHFSKWNSVFGFTLFSISVFLLSRNGFETVFGILGRIDATRIMPPPISGGASISIPYYNLGLQLTACCLGLHCGLLSAIQIAQRKIEIPKFISNWFLLLGRYALESYVLHLSLLVLIMLNIQWRPFSIRIEKHPLQTANQGLLTLFGVLVACSAWAMAREMWIHYRRGTQSS